ncbi:hypothetical protein JOM56_005110 [Amanita muscaria]
MTQPHTSPSSSPPPAHSLSSPLDPAIPISAIPTTQLSLDRLSTLCRPVFEEEQSRNPVIAWAGIFGSVQRGTQRPDSDVDFLVGYAADAEFCADVCGSYTQLQRRLPEILGREVDLVVFKQDSDNFGYVHLEALLTAETIWGDPSWVHSSREAAERLLREGYETSKKALQVASRLYERLPSSQAEFVSPRDKALQISILEDALFVITTVKIPKHPFYAKEEAIRAALEGEVESSGDLEDIWNVLSDKMNVFALKGMLVAQVVTDLELTGWWCQRGQNECGKSPEVVLAR